MKRILDCQSSDFLNITREELLGAIASGEGRTIACETIGAIMPMLGDITNAEFAAAMGADILLLNVFDVQKPHIQGLDYSFSGIKTSLLYFLRDQLKENENFIGNFIFRRSK